jgi:hypothetical protein
MTRSTIPIAQFCTIALFFLSTLPLTVSSALAETPNSQTEARAALERVAQGTDACRGLTATWTEGNGVDGWVTVEVARERVIVRHQANRRENGAGQSDHWFTGRLESDDCRDIARLGADPSLRDLRSSRAFSGFGETRPRLTIGVGGTDAVTAEQWSGEARNNRGFAAARRLLASLARRISDGRITVAVK